MNFVQNIEKQIIALGHAISWLALFLVIIVCLSVFLRYVLGLSSLGFDELQWHIYSFGFMMGFSYCTSMETHVRNDLFYSKFSEKTKLWIDLVSHLVVLLPFIIVIIYHSWFFMMRAYVTAEGSIVLVGYLTDGLLNQFWCFHLCYLELQRWLDQSQLLQN